MCDRVVRGSGYRNMSANSTYTFFEYKRRSGEIRVSNQDFITFLFYVEDLITWKRFNGTMEIVTCNYYLHEIASKKVMIK